MEQIGFTGSRGYPKPELVRNFVLALARKYPGVAIVSGGRGAVDEAAEAAGVEAGLEVISYRPTETGIEVHRYHPGDKVWSVSPLKGYPNFVRNCFFRNDFIAASNRVVGFWDLQSRGTADTLSKAKGKRRPRTVYGPDGVLCSEEDVDVYVYAVLG